MRLILAILVAVVTFALLALLLKIRERDRNEISERLAYASGQLHRQRTGRGGPRQRQSSGAAKFLAMVKESATRLQQLQKKNSFDLKMQQADWPLLGTEFEVILLLLGILLGILAFAMTLKPVMGLAGAAGGVLLGIIYLDIHIKRRRAAFTNQLGDMLSTIANAMRAGFSFLQAFEVVAREMDAPASREVQKVMNEINVGSTMDVALNNMQQRVQSSDFQLIVTAVLIQRQVGGNLAQILDTISDTIRERIRMKGEVKALTAQGRASGVVLAALPPGLGLMINTMDPNYLKPLFNDPTGQKLLVMGIVMELLGFYVINRIVDIKL